MFAGSMPRCMPANLPLNSNLHNLGGLLRVQLLLQDNAELLLQGLELLKVLLVLALVLDLGLDACGGC